MLTTTQTSDEVYRLQAGIHRRQLEAQALQASAAALAAGRPAAAEQILTDTARRLDGLTDRGHQPREQSVSCIRCRRVKTWHAHAVCSDCGTVTCPRCAPTPTGAHR